MSCSLKICCVALVCWALTACADDDAGSVQDAAVPRDAALRDAAQAMDAAASQDAAARDAGRTQEASASPPNFDVPVVMYERGSYVPAEGALVRIDDAYGDSVEGEVSAEGSAGFALDPATAPWDVTVVDLERGAVSILGVTEPFDAPVHLRATAGESIPVPVSPRVFRGAIVGRTYTNRDWVRLYSDAIASFEDRGTSYRAWLADATRSGIVHAIAVENGDLDEPPINVARVELDFSVDDLDHMDIVFPLPPPAQRLVTMTLRTPSIGRLSTLEPRPDRYGVAYRRAGTGFISLGSSTVVPRTAGEYEWTVAALDSPISPRWATLALVEPDSSDSVEVTAEIEDGAIVEVYAYERLELTLDEDGTAYVAWDAAAYSGAGASLQSVDPATGHGWFVYSFAGASMSPRPWPKLPSGMTFRDLGLTGTIRVNLFAYDTQGVPIWDWTATEAQVAVVATSEREVVPE
jgi:hypothetical protein